MRTEREIRIKVQEQKTIMKYYGNLSKSCNQAYIEALEWVLNETNK